MKFLLLWSGEVKGMKKTEIPAVENNIGTVGTWNAGKLYLPDGFKLRSAMPYRFLKAYDRQANWHNLPQIWVDATNNDAPLTFRLSNSRGKIMLIGYCQPIA